MGRRRTLFLGSIIGAISLLVAPRAGGRRRGVGRRRAARRLRGASLAAFAGTPCSVERGAEMPDAAPARVVGADTGVMQAGADTGTKMGS